jgi:hypothetical protein
VAATRGLVAATLTATDLPPTLQGPGFSAPSGGPGAGNGTGPWATLDALLGALGRLAVTHRTTGGL